ncbi:protein of unknown function,migth belong to SSS sodium solute transporter superfamily [Shewanella benthica]|uniref:Uncharacterized protein n=1 Tax=Shewanella benthica TaxID=43661 RepID=A0A330MEW6_9GAMM|nr:hypothetical protein [Shewanella benthica]SQH78357.1 protein of unknown function,migth belong to SSS sodium solute transporter superfamily [Shewanella benthica]
MSYFDRGPEETYADVRKIGTRVTLVFKNVNAKAIKIGLIFGVLFYAVFSFV